MEKDKAKDEHKANHLDEPQSHYERAGEGEIRFFSSFDEMSEADAKTQASKPFIEHLSNATKLIEQLYQRELSKKMNALSLTFK